jgi:hypothetical protein
MDQGGNSFGDNFRGKQDGNQTIKSTSSESQISFKNAFSCKNTLMQQTNVDISQAETQNDSMDV